MGREAVKWALGKSLPAPEGSVDKMALSGGAGGRWVATFLRPPPAGTTPGLLPTRTAGGREWVLAGVPGFLERAGRSAIPRQLLIPTALYFGWDCFYTYDK